MTSATTLLQELIRCPSVTPADGGALALIAERLKAVGFETHIVQFDEPGTPSVRNLYARSGSARPCLLFAGHTDVVPPGDLAGWRYGPFAGTIADGLIFGRGACDMKGGLAAYLAAAITFVAEGRLSAGSIAFLITGDEEGPAVNGTVKLLDWAVARGEVFDQCVLGEPTNPDALGDMIKIGRRGSLSGTITAIGRQGHVAYPDRACNPIPGLLRLIDALVGIPLDEPNEHFDASNCEVVSIDVGNPSTNVIPAQATAVFNIRFNDRWTPEALQAEIKDRISQVAVDCDYKLAFRPCNAHAFVTEPNAFTHLFSAVVEDLTGRRPKLSTAGGTSDARFIVGACPVLEFGLVGQTMHAVDECASIADVETLTAIGRAVLERYFEDAGPSGR